MTIGYPVIWLATYACVSLSLGNSLLVKEVRQYSSVCFVVSSDITFVCTFLFSSFILFKKWRCRAKTESFHVMAHWYPGAKSSAQVSNSTAYPGCILKQEAGIRNRGKLWTKLSCYWTLASQAVSVPPVSLDCSVFFLLACNTSLPILDTISLQMLDFTMVSASLSLMFHWLDHIFQRAGFIHFGDIQYLFLKKIYLFLWSS